MSMSVGTGSEENTVMSNINTTPLVDVMLVLLIIFLITIPVITKTVPVVLPKAVNIPTQTKPENITIAVDKDGNVYWNDKRVADRNALLAFVKEAAAGDSHPRRQGYALRGDRPRHVRDPARRHRQGRLSDRARPRHTRLPLKRGAQHGNECRYRLRGHLLRHQHDAPHRRDAGAAGHAHRDAARHDPRRQARHAERDQPAAAPAHASGGHRPRDRLRRRRGMERQ